MTDPKAVIAMASEKLAKLGDQFADAFSLTFRADRKAVDSLIAKVLEAAHEAHEQVLGQEFKDLLMTATERRLIEDINSARYNFRKLFGSHCIPADSVEYESMREFDRLADAQVTMVLARVGRRSLNRGDGK